MEINKDKFRELIREDRLGPAFQQLSDIGHFLGDERVQHDIARLRTKYQALNPAAGQAEDEKEAVKRELLGLIDRLPEDFTPADGDAKARKGCLGSLFFVP